MLNPELVLVASRIPQDLLQSTAVAAEQSLIAQ